MVYKVLFHKAIEKDYIEAYEWYENRQPGLGERFLLKVRDKISSILSHPEIYPVKGNNRYREALIADFPFSIVYKVYESKNEVFIISVHHHKKNPA